MTSSSTAQTMSAASHSSSQMSRTMIGQRDAGGDQVEREHGADGHQGGADAELLRATGDLGLGEVDLRADQACGLLAQIGYQLAQRLLVARRSRLRGGHGHDLSSART